ncbi:hypothetical protein B0H16DRAFT_1239258, partial [Mycena metata]
GSQYIDRLYQETMEAKETKDEALESLWGPLLCDSAPIAVYVEGVAAKGSKTSAGIFYGPGSKYNQALRVPGPGHMSADRARLFAIYQTLLRAPSDKSLLIFCTSKMIDYPTTLLCCCLEQYAGLGRSNGDLFKAVFQLLAARHGGIRFVHVGTKEDNQSKREAYALA